MSSISFKVKKNEFNKRISITRNQMTAQTSVEMANNVKRSKFTLPRDISKTFLELFTYVNGGKDIQKITLVSSSLTKTLNNWYTQIKNKEYFDVNIGMLKYIKNSKSPRYKECKAYIEQLHKLVEDIICISIKNCEPKYLELYSPVDFYNVK